MVSSSTPRCGSLTINFQQCPLLNISYSPPTKTDLSSGKISVVVVYNSQGWKRSDVIRLPDLDALYAAIVVSIAFSFIPASFSIAIMKDINNDYGRSSISTVYEAGINRQIKKPPQLTNKNKSSSIQFTALDCKSVDSLSHRRVFIDPYHNDELLILRCIIDDIEIKSVDSWKQDEGR
ncbi:unnamed protein product [Lactuca saligna]|uniref:Uncharacterized protein n=1 Tax=Lactuca saligna TaxID=75948 RepID=A0AA35YWV1_LACSI|nr:unnamed protein product [Lactuca saligna]